jgi:UDP-2-acetamido-3-amino-2,3-dideoxy-glucuronate N-acetyltransferase
MKAYIHPSATVETGAQLEDDVKVWHSAHVRAGAHLKNAVSIGKDVYIDAGVIVGTGSRIQNGVNVYKGVEISSWCFVGPAVVFTNDQYPRIGRKNWKIVSTHIDDGCSIGAGAIIRCGIRLGAFSMIGAGAVVTKDVPAFCLATGLPAEITHRICACADTSLPLISGLNELIRDCCEKNLETQVLEIAKDKVKELKAQQK